MFNPADFFKLASNLGRRPNADEATHRSAISRAYYAVFLSARDKLFGFDEVQLTEPVKKKLRKKHKLEKGDHPGSHELIIFAVSLQSLVLSQQLDLLKTARVIADYKLDPKHLKSQGFTTWKDYSHQNLTLTSQLLPTVSALKRHK